MFTGITANLFFIAVVCIISWYQIISSEEYVQYLEDCKDKEAITSEGKNNLHIICNIEWEFSTLKNIYKKTKIFIKIYKKYFSTIIRFKR